MLLGQRHRPNDIAVVVGELAREEHRPVVVAAFGQLVAGPRTEDDDRHIFGEIVAFERRCLLAQLPCGVPSGVN